VESTLFIGQTRAMGNIYRHVIFGRMGASCSGARLVDYACWGLAVLEAVKHSLIREDVDLK
jgi:hypothetical protein